MQVLIKGVDSSLVKEISELAKEQGVSRNQFIKNYMSMIPYNLTLDYEVGYLENVISRVSKSVEITNARLKSLEDSFEKLYQLIMYASNIDEFELQEIIKTDVDGVS